MSEQRAQSDRNPHVRDPALQWLLEELCAAVARNRADIDALQAKVGEVTDRADATEEYAAHLEQALRSSRMIGAAIGLVMADRKVSAADAFAILSKASQDTNRRLTVLAHEVVSKGDVSGLSLRQVGTRQGHGNELATGTAGPSSVAT